MRSSILVVLLFFTINLFSQVDIIKIENGSFEGKPRAGEYYSPIIKGWYDCGAEEFPRETAPDIHPIDFWNVSKPSHDGKTYIGMVIRDNKTWESVSTKLSSPLEAGNCYKFDIHLVRSASYLSGSRSRADDVLLEYTTPAVLRIWGSNEFCGKKYLLAQSTPVDNFNWEEYQFDIEINQNCKFISLEAYYDNNCGLDTDVIPYNGHILLDSMSDIIKVSCISKN